MIQFIPLLKGLGLGAVVYGVFQLSSDEDEQKEAVDNGSTLRKVTDKPNGSQPLKQPSDTVKSTVNLTAENTVNEALKTEQVMESIPENSAPEVDEKEMIRRAMSELGKRSAEKRRLRKLKTE
ncbi:MAG: hypothetical protein CMF60_05235 [Magnetococcales bacterium]|nr:hypothetical protein [Magnetococcales bacterium]|tara:strand:+ start:7777 stop:8145 length:369 start_codon:yes stop_codon:yes gene_type:complete